MKSKFSKMTPKEVEMHEKYNLDSYMDVKRPFNEMAKRILLKEASIEDLNSICRHQLIVMQKGVNFRKKKKDAESDPILKYLGNQDEYLTMEQVALFEKIKSNQQLVEWNRFVAPLNSKYLTTISPRVLMHKTDFDEKTQNWSISEWKNFLGYEKEEDYHESLFPEKPWKGNHLMLQFLYFSLQLERSHSPRYVRSIDFIDGEGFLTRALWRGVWMLPESLSNYVYIRDPLPPKAIQDININKPVEAKKQEGPPPKIEPVRPIAPPIRIEPKPVEITPPQVQRTAPDIRLGHGPIVPREIPPPRVVSRVSGNRIIPDRVPNRDNVRYVGVQYEPELWKALEKRLFG
jgi:hypothetical protein